MRQDWKQPKAETLRTRLLDSVGHTARRSESAREEMQTKIDEKGLHHAYRWGFVEAAAIKERVAHHAFYYWNFLKDASDDELVEATLGTLTNHVLARMVQERRDEVEYAALLEYARLLNQYLDWPLGVAF